MKLQDLQYLGRQKHPNLALAFPAQVGYFTLFQQKFSFPTFHFFYILTKTTLSQLRSSFCSSLHSYRERITLIPSSLCPSCGVESHTHTTVHVFACSSHPTPLTERLVGTSATDVRVPVWPPFLQSPPFPHPPLEPPSSSRQES